LECAGFLSFNVFTLAAPIILEEASEGALDAAGVARSKRLKDAGGVMPAIEKMKSDGQWSADCDPFVDLSPLWADNLAKTWTAITTNSGLPAKDIELVFLALHASLANFSTTGTKRHIRGALRAGASVEEVAEVLKICVAQGVETCNLGVTILDRELRSRGAA
jgi:alkylhydroperoxidase/carboxymuconolactone decarboxylase family protein YurZ